MKINFSAFIASASLIFILFYPFLAAAQTGTIAGTVTDAENNEELIGATIAVLQTSLGSTTDLDGKFTIANVPAGSYSLKISYVGYESKELSNVQVTAGVTTTIHITIGVAKTNTLNEVTITAEARKETQTAMLMAQKNSGAISNFISSDMIRRSPDKNTSEVLKRVSGVTIQDNKFVVVRGMNDRYNQAMLNGALLPSSEPDRKTFSFDIFPAAIVDNITIVKSATPDMPGDFSGGLVQINTKDIPDKSFISLKAGGGYNSISTFKPYYTYQGGQTDWIGIDDGTRALPEGFPSYEAFKHLGEDEKIAAGKLLLNNWGYSKKESSPVNPSFELAGGFKIGKSAFPYFGGIFGVTYNSSRRLTAIDRYDYYNHSEPLEDSIYKYNDSAYQRNILSSALADFAFKINPNNKISLNNIYSVNSVDQVVLRSGYSWSQGVFVKSNSFFFSSNQISNSQLTGDHYIPKAKLRIRWLGYYTNLNRDEPDYRRNLYWKNSEDEPYYAVLSSSPSTNIGAGVQYFGEITDHAYGGNVDLSEPFQFLNHPQTIKFGGSYYHGERNREVRILSNIISDPGNFNYNYYNSSQDTIFAPSHFDATTGFILSEDESSTNHYDGSIKNIAAYAMLDNKFTDRIRLVWGVRFESYHSLLNTFDQSNKPYLVDTIYNDVLPSANLILSILKDANLRLTFNRAVAHPSYRELANSPFYDFLQNITYYGNPKLVETHITNFELRWEHFLPSAQYYSFSAFYKMFQNPIEQNLSFPGSDSRGVQFVNVPEATDIGIELEGRKNLAFIGKGWENLAAYANFTYIRSKVFVKGATSDTSANRPLEGQSPMVINVSLQYDEPNTHLGLSVQFNAIGYRLYLVGSVSDKPVWQQVHPTLDLKITKTFLKNGLIEVVWNDILHGNDIFYEDLNGNGTYESEASKAYSENDRLIALQHFGYNLSAAVRYAF